jgi:hypothetical protein
MTCPDGRVVIFQKTGYASLVVALRLRLVFQYLAEVRYRDG